MIHLLTSFLIGGLLVAGSKYISDIGHSRYAALFAGIPIGILPIFFLKTQKEKQNYLTGFLFSSIILAITVFAMFIISKKYNTLINYICLIGLPLWAFISVLTIILLTHKDSRHQLHILE